jgi:nanoRNase/pAp phosphatase (c-di-AMP/oligoRNAs hydrolase)
MGSASTAMTNDRTALKLRLFTQMIADKKSLLIVLQDYPDPDALASAAALRALVHKLGNLNTTVTSGGPLGRAENRALFKYQQLPYRPLAEVDPARFDLVALLDTQPGTGNNALPESTRTHIVIDHHPIKNATRSVPFTDIRSSYGATSTILYEYLREAAVTIDTKLATALLYGIRSDTQDLGRQTHRADIDAVLVLYPLANNRQLYEIRYSKTPRSYFGTLATALRTARVYEDAVICWVDGLDIPDVIGEVADLVLRDEAVTWSLCAGKYDNRLLISVRTSDPKGNAGKVVSRLVKGLGTGGGHSAMAGGQIPLNSNTTNSAKAMSDEIRKRYLRILKKDARKGASLVKEST